MEDGNRGGLVSGTGGARLRVRVTGALEQTGAVAVLWAMTPFPVLGPRRPSAGDLYRTEVRQERKRHSAGRAPSVRDVDLERLPDPVRGYLRRCGWVGRPLALNAEVEWSESAIRLGPGRPWMELDTHQFNSVAEPMRAAYMRGRFLGLVPMEGRDLYQDGSGHMLIRLAGRLTVGDVTGPEMDQSALVTILAETLLVPGYALQPYVEWTPVDARTARATVRHRGTAAAGTFHFGAEGDFRRFDTDDRYYGTGPDVRRVPWTAEALEHGEQDSLRIVRALRAVWHLPEGDFEYFTGRIGRLRFNVGVDREDCGEREP
jgi:hypothetical protein